MFSILKRNRRALSLAACLLLPLLVGTCTRATPGPWNVLFVVVDTLRADRLSLYGYRRATSPNLDAFARQAVVFTAARSPAGCTFPSANSLLTSRDPAVFLLDPAAGMGIPATVRSLPEILRARGYSTAAVSASPIARATPSEVNPVGGFGRGFQSFDEECLDRHARCLNQKAAGLLPKLPQPFFLYLHYMEPHAPYHPASDHVRRFASDSDDSRQLGIHPWAWSGDNTPVMRRIYDGDTTYEFTPRDLAFLSDLYDEEIAYFDEQLAQLLDLLRSRHLFDHTLIVLAADHGEEQYEHGGYGHCRSLAWETILKTPIVLRIPGMESGVRRRALVDNLDIVPTLLDYLGIATAGLRLDGVSLRPVIEDDRRVHRLAFGNQGNVRTVTDGVRKLSFDQSSNAVKLFDLAADPEEQADLAAQRPAEARRLEAALLGWMQRHEGSSDTSHRRAAEIEKQLRALGYL